MAKAARSGEDRNEVSIGGAPRGRTEDRSVYRSLVRES
jgi:hypothetical protein